MPDVERVVVEAERLGYHHVTCSEHVAVPRAVAEVRGATYWDPLATFGYLAARTSTIRLATFVLVLGYHHPLAIAKRYGTLDRVCGGRLILGVGAGWFQRDYDEYGYDFGTPGQRLKNLERGLEVIKARWERDEPKPLRGTVPILIGGGGEKVTLRITAQHADLWNGFGPAEQWDRKNRILDDWCREVGRDPAAIERTASIGAEDVGRLDPFVEAGATHLICRLGAPFDLAAIERLLEWRDRTQ